MRYWGAVLREDIRGLARFDPGHSSPTEPLNRATVIPVSWMDPLKKILRHVYVG